MSRRRSAPRHAASMPPGRRRLAISVGVLLVVSVVVPAIVVGRTFSTQLYDRTGVTRAVPSDPAPIALPPAIPVDPSRSQSRTPAPTQATATVQGRQDLTGWASQLGVALDIPPEALTAYGQAELAVSAAVPDCNLSWATLAGLGWVESDHGRYHGARVDADGRSSPPIIGVALDGAPGLRAIPDTDDGRLDGDPVLDRAVGALQFIPQTWARWAADGDGDGLADPFDIDDAALAAARYLCAAGGDLGTATGWTAAVYAYNASDGYVVSVRAAANQYAALSLAVVPVK